MQWCVFVLVIYLCGSIASRAQEQLTLLPDTPKPQPGIIVGTVVDVNDDAIPGATVILEGSVVNDSSRPRTPPAGRVGPDFVDCEQNSITFPGWS
jgi:hypothetical protein